jgi:hypothetical protein
MWHVWVKGELFTGFRWGDLRGRDHSEDPGIRWEENIKIDFHYEGWGGGMDWIDLAQDRDRWRALVNTVMNLRLP